MALNKRITIVNVFIYVHEVFDNINPTILPDKLYKIEIRRHLHTTWLHSNKLKLNASKS